MGHELEDGRSLAYAGSWKSQRRSRIGRNQPETSLREVEVDEGLPAEVRALKRVKAGSNHSVIEREIVIRV